MSPDEIWLAAAWPFVRDWLPEKIGLATAVYSNGLLVGELLAVPLTLPVVLPLVGGSWRLSFVAWSVPVLATAALVGWVVLAVVLVLITIEVPALPVARNSVYLKFRDRQSYEFALVSVAAAIEEAFEHGMAAADDAHLVAIVKFGTDVVAGDG